MKGLGPEKVGIVMSVSLGIFKWILKKSKIKESYDRPVEEINQMTVKKNSRRKFDLTSDKTFGVEKLQIENRPVMILHNRANTGKALLYFYGGGFTTEMSRIEKRAAVKFGKRSSRDVWIPRYPSCLDVSVRETYQMALETYRKMLDVYEPNDIAVIGFSAGADIGLGMFEYNNTMKDPLPPPGLLILSSPACIPSTEAERKTIRELEEADLMIPASFVHSIKETMCHGEELPDYMTQLTTGNLTNMPYTHIYYGSDEILSAAAPLLAAAYHKYGSECELHIGPGMFHCYPAIDLFPETKAAFDEIVGYLS